MGNRRVQGKKTPEKALAGKTKPAASRAKPTSSRASVAGKAGPAAKGKVKPAGSGKVRAPAKAKASTVAPTGVAAPIHLVARSKAAATLKALARPEASARAKVPAPIPTATRVNKAAAPAKLIVPHQARAKAAPPARAVGPAPGAAALEPAAPVKAAALGKLPGPTKGSAAKLKAPKRPEARAPEPVLPKKPARKSIKEAAGVSTDAVARRTGKNWDDWFEVLDSAGAATLDQRGVVAILAQKHGIGPWWQQMIAVGYESLRGKSDKPPAPDGFQISNSCTLDAPVSRVFRLWHDSGERARWLADDRFVLRATTANRVIRARWGKGTSQVAVSFREKSGRTEVSVEHVQIESRGAADQMQAYWEKKLALLEQTLAPRS